MVTQNTFEKSNGFYNYIADIILDYLNNNSFRSGEKYSISFDDNDKVRKLYNSFKINEDVKEFKHKNYSTFYCNINGYKLIIAATINDIKVDYLTYLRNSVAENNGDFENTNILFIHDSDLDSIVGGTIELDSFDKPLNINNFNENIIESINASHLKNTEKEILKFSVKKQENEIINIFDYKVYFNVIYDGEINNENMKELGFFNDDGISSVEGNELNNRLKENYKLFSKVNEIYKYKDPDTDLKKYFDRKGLNLLKSSDWKETEFKLVKNSNENKKNEKNVSYKPFEDFSDKDSLIYDKSNGDTKAQRRKRNILVFNRGNKNQIRIKLSFHSELNEKLDDTPQYMQNSDFSYTINKKSISIVINNLKELKKVKYIKLKYHKHIFKIAIINTKATFFEQIRTKYKVIIKQKNRYILVNEEGNELLLGEAIKRHNSEVINIKKSNEIIKLNNKKSYKLNYSNLTPNKNNMVFVNINFMNFIVNFAVLVEEKTSNEYIKGNEIFKLKREKERIYKYNAEDKKVIYDVKEYIIKNKTRKFLEYEYRFINTKACYAEINNNELLKKDITLDNDIFEAYNEILEYFEKEKYLPTLTYYNNKILEKFKNFYSIYIKKVNKLKNNEKLTSKNKNLLKIGVIKDLEEEKIYMTPLHPLNIVFQIEVYKRLENKNYSNGVLNQLNTLGIMPYILENNNLYERNESNEMPEWSEYVLSDTQSKNILGSYVGDIVKHKILEFEKHFKYLFISKRSPLIIKAINFNNHQRIFEGILSYYAQKLKKNSKNLLCIDIYLDKDADQNIFRRVSRYETFSDIKDIFDIKIKPNLKNQEKEKLLKVFRNNVHYYQKNNIEKEYSHITFFGPNYRGTYSREKVKNIESSIKMNGLVSSISTNYSNGSYDSGFGIKGIDKKSKIIKLGIAINSLIIPADTGDVYSKGDVIVKSINLDNIDDIDSIYQNTNWVTFIKPKFKLDYFNQDDTVIIHYNDQHTAASNYDAITVTKNIKQYEGIINNFLEDKVNKKDNFNVKETIETFNMLNGKWLLDLIVKDSKIIREKFSILSASKLLMGMLSHKDIFWIPISLEEIIRISNASGLSSKGTPFAMLKGSFSDDLLMVGIEVDSNEKIFIHYYPVEVKVGKNNSSVIKKAKKQLRNTYKMIEKYFIKEKEFTKNFYNNFILSIALSNFEKMKLKNIESQEKLELITNEVIDKINNSDFTISTELYKYIGKGMIFSFKRDKSFQKINIDNEIQIASFPESIAYKKLQENIDKIRKKYLSNKTDINKEKLIAFNYKKNKEPLNNISDNKNKKRVKNEYNDNNEKQGAIEILLGHNEINQNKEYFRINDTSIIENPNIGIVGTMGTGKTQFTQSLITQLNSNKNNVNGTKINFLIFDYKKDYIDGDFKSVNDVKKYNLYKLPFNPLKIVFDKNNHKPLLPMHIATSLKDTISKAYGLGIVQQNILKECIMEAYEEKGIVASNVDTWNNICPTIKDVYNSYMNRENIKQDKLYTALNQLKDFQIFEPEGSKTKSLYEILDGVTVINVSEYSESIQELVIAITLDVFYRDMIKQGHSKINKEFRELTNFILVDEADNFLRNNYDSIRKILKEGRSFGVGTILSTQYLSHFTTTENNYGQYISNWIVHKVDEISKKEVSKIFNSESKSESKEYISKIRSLDKHFSLTNVNEYKKAICIKDKAFWEMVKENKFDL